jgi:carboxyl-terminal processing protease
VTRWTRTGWLVLVAAHAAAAQGTAPARPTRTVYEDLQMFTQVLNQIRLNHADSVDTHELILAAVRGMVQAADPHSFVVASYHMDPARDKAYRDGKLVTVPITFAFDADAPMVVSVAPNTAASRLDILPGDELVAIDGKPVTAQSPFELGMVTSGAPGSSLTLAFQRHRADGSSVQITRVVKRERTGDVSAVATAFMLDARTGYVRVTSFENEHVADDVHDALSRLEGQNMQRLVLDLRDNPGGIVPEASKVAGEFLPKGAVVYTSTGRTKDVTDTGRVSRSFWRSEERYPIVLLVNSGTASAAELVAGALQDHDRALILGHDSFGKALLMTGFPLSDGSFMEMVVGRVRTPCGRVIQREYHGISRRDYYRLAGADADTTGRPSCRTDGGRTVYGGNGIHPDVVLPQVDVPAWAARAGEADLYLRWAGSHIASNAAAYPSLDALAAHPALVPGSLDSFRALAAQHDITIPRDAETDRALERMLVREVAFARWGQSGYYRLRALTDAEVAAAVDRFDAASGILAAH